METAAPTVDGSAASEYFDSYDDLDVHELMLRDTARIQAYKNAIFSCIEYFRDKVVMDVGAGTGILSLFCAQAGARVVYAVEASALANIIPKVAKENNFSDVIKVFKQRVEDVILPECEKVDVIVSEWMGFYLLHEGMLDSVLYARDAHMKAGGKMFPEVAELWCAPCSLPDMYDFWDNVEGVHMQSVGEAWRLQKSRQPQIVNVTGNDLLAEPVSICVLNLNNISSKELDSVSGKFVLPTNRDGKYQGICLWFSCVFPCLDDGSRGTVLSTAPTESPTHWKQTVVMLPHEFVVDEGMPVAWELRLHRSSVGCRQYNIEFTELDPEEVKHPVPCRCYMTKCVVIRIYLEQKEDLSEGEEDEENEDESGDSCGSSDLASV